MSWAEVKKINSDMEEPLNEKLDAISELIKGQRSLAASDAVMAVLKSTESEYSNSISEEIGTMIGSFVPEVDGSVRVEVSTKVESGSHPGYINIVRNGVVEYAVKTGSGGSYNAASIDIPVKRGETYSIAALAYGGSYTLYVNSVKICASIIDGSLLSYEIF